MGTKAHQRAGGNAHGAQHMRGLIGAGVELRVAERVMAHDQRGCVGGLGDLRFEQALQRGAAVIIAGGVVPAMDDQIALGLGHQRQVFTFSLCLCHGFEPRGEDLCHGVGDLRAVIGQRFIGDAKYHAGQVTKADRGASRGLAKAERQFNGKAGLWQRITRAVRGPGAGQRICILCNGNVAGLFAHRLRRPARHQIGARLLVQRVGPSERGTPLPGLTGLRSGGGERLHVIQAGAPVGLRFGEGLGGVL